MVISVSKIRENARTGANAPIQATTSPAPPPKAEIRGEGWFEAVKNDMKIAPQAIEYYKTVLQDSKKHISLIGALETLLLETPGLAHWYRQITIDAQMLERLFIDRKESLTKKKYHEYAADPKFEGMKTTELQKLAASDEQVLVLEEWTRLFEYYKKSLDNVCQFFEDRKYTLNNIKDIRVNKLEEVWIDSSKETHI